MRKHILGFAIFSAIVTAAVFLYGFLNTPPIPVIPAVDYPTDQRATAPRSGPGFDKIHSRVSVTEFDVKDRTFRAQVAVEWYGKHEPQTSMYMRVHFMSADGKGIGMSKTIFANDWFARGGRTALTVTVDGVDSRFAGNENLYTFIEFSSDGSFASTPDQRFASAKITPVVLFHGQTRRSAQN